MARPPQAPAKVPGKPVIARYATPNLSDRIYVERKDTRLANYKLPAKGAAYDGPQAGKWAGFKFATAVPAPEMPEWEDWYYLNVRANQDDYNYAIEFPGGDKTIPQITRTYAFLRADYVEIADNATDPIYTGAVLVDRKIIRSEDPILDALFIMVQRVFELLPGVPLVRQQLGSPNLIPEKYRRLVHDIETKQPVPAGYTFPSALTGDQAEIELAQESITKARLRVLEQVITIHDAMVGGKTDNWGDLVIYESIVNEGDPIDEGFLVKDSSVTPLGNGKSIKISVNYPANLASVALLEKTLGQDNLIPAKYRGLVRHIITNTMKDPDVYTFPSVLTGDQAEIDYIQDTIHQARLKIIEEIIAIGGSLIGHEQDKWGFLTIDESIVVDGTAAEDGYLVVKSTVTPLGNGKSIKITVSYPANLAAQVLLSKTLGQDNLIPEKYRGLVRHNVNDSLVDSDTYVFPSVLTGDQTQIEYIEETLHRARLKIIEEIIDISSSLVGHEQDKWGFLVITESIVVDLTPADDTYFTVKSSVTPLGNGKSIKITVAYPANLAAQVLLTKTLGQDSLIPEKYRNLVRHDITDRLVDADTYVFPVGLTGDQSQIEYIEETLHRARLKIVEEIIDTDTSLIGHEQDKWGFLTITESIVVDGTAADDTYLTVKSTVTPLGNGKSVKITVAYPAGLAAVALLSKTLGQDSLIPEKYRNLVRHDITDSLVDADTYVFPSVLTGDQSQIEYIEETLHRARLKIVEEVIDTDTSLVGHEQDKWGFLTITESIVADGTAADDTYLTVKSSVTPLGNGKSIKITVAYPAGLAAVALLSKTLGQDSLIPEKYRNLVRHDITDSLVDVDTYVFPSVLTGDQSQIEYIEETLHRARLKIVEEIIDTDTSLIGHEQDKWGFLTITESIVVDGTAADDTYLTVKSSVTPLGNGKSVKITVAYPAGLASVVLLSKTLGQDNLIPEKYRGLVRHDITDKLVDSGTYVFPSVLTGDQTQIEYIEETLHRARLKIIEEIIAVGSTLVGKEQDKWGFLTITESIVDDGTAADDTFFTLKSTVTPLGNGKSVKITVAYPADLASQIRTDKTIGQSNLIPEKYRGLVQHSEDNKFVDATTYSFPTALTGDQTQIDLIQDTINRARLKIAEEIIGTGSALSGKEHDKWGRLTITESIVNDGAAESTGFLILKSSVTPLGNGKSIKITVSYPSDVSDTPMGGQEYDPTLDVVIPYIETLRIAGHGIGTNRTQVEPQTTERELDRTADTDELEAILDTYLLRIPGTTNLQLPDVLESLDSFSENRSGEGFFSETGEAGFSGSGSASLDIRGSGNSSASIMPTVVPTISQTWGHNVPTRRFMLFLQMPVTVAAVLTKLNTLASLTVSPWPKFKPEGATIICVGEALTLTTEASAKWMVGGSDSGSQFAFSEGSGASRRLELTINTVRVPPTLHETLATGDIINDTVDIDCEAHAVVTDSIRADIAESGTVTGRAFGNIPATNPAALPAPSDGDYLFDLKAEPWRYGWALIHCEIINFADVAS